MPHVLELKNQKTNVTLNIVLIVNRRSVRANEMLKATMDVVE